MGRLQEEELRGKQPLSCTPALPPQAGAKHKPSGQLGVIFFAGGVITARWTDHRPASPPQSLSTSIITRIHRTVPGREEKGREAEKLNLGPQVPDLMKSFMMPGCEAEGGEEPGGNQEV